MADWDSEQYLKFKAQRTQPSVDLVNRITTQNPKKILDIGCGPGNSTAVLRSKFPEAYILGIDSSPAMVEKAKNTYTDIDFQLFNASTGLDSLDGTFDIIFSNACLQWIPNHHTLIPNIINKLNYGGTLAVQIPANANSPFFQEITEVASDSKWRFENVELEKNDILKSEEYFDILSACSSSFDIWEIVYYHNMPSHQSLVEWVKGTRLRPYINALKSNEEKAEFEEAILEKAKERYTAQSNGEIIFKFKRLFFTAVK